MTTMKLSAKFRRTNAQIHEKQGRLLTTNEQQRQRWTDHFQDNKIWDKETHLRRYGVATHRGQMKSLRKPYWLMVKSQPPCCIHWEKKRICEEERNIPADWTVGLIAIIPKKGNLRDCNNYRGIMINTSQCAQPHFPRQTTSIANNSTLHTNTKPKYVNIIKSTYQDMRRQILCQGHTHRKHLQCLRRWFKAFFYDWIMKQTINSKTTGIQCNLTQHLENLNFDDVALLSYSHQHTQNKSVQQTQNL